MKRKIILWLLSGLLMCGAIYLWKKPKSLVQKLSHISFAIPFERFEKKKDLEDEVKEKKVVFSKLATELEQKKDLEGEYAFAFDLLKNIPKENTILSPLGLRLALGMVLAGAREKTATDIAKTIKVKNNDHVHDIFSSTISDLPTSMDPTLPTQFNLIGRVWAREGNKYEPFFESLLEQKYGAPFEPLDFRNKAGESRKRINEWVEKQTNQKIQNFIASDNELIRTSLLLTNAIYFKAKWVFPFTEWMTHSDSFNVTKDKSVDVPMMEMKQSFFYGHLENVKILELPYVDDAFSMVIVLPDGYELSKMESELNESKLNNWFLQLKFSEVELKLPKFEFTKALSFKESLSKMGMEIVFDRSKANFTGMTPNGQLAIDDVIQQAYVRVNEEGTEAAAVTKVTMGASPAILPDPSLITFHVDHPFLFFILDKTHGHILFMGRVVDPTK